MHPSNCGLPSHQAGKHCPAKGKTCAFCGKLNHFASVCRQKHKPANGVRRIFVNPIPDEPRINKITPGHPTSQLLSTCDERTVACRTPTITVRLLNSRKPGHTTAATADTGACAIILGTDLFHEMGMNFDELTDRGTDTLSAADGFRLQSIGRTALDLDHEGTTFRTTAIVCRGVKGLLLSWFASLRLNAYLAPSPSSMVASATPETAHTLKAKLLDEFADVFDDSGPLKTMKGSPMSIELVPDAVPFDLSNARPIPIS